MTWSFSQRSERYLANIHPDLAKVVRLALQISAVDFVVIDGLRTLETQQALVAAGASQTMNSRHLTGHAVDIAPWINRSIPWKDWQAFALVAQAMKQAAQDLNIPLIWGGDWKTLKDGPHFELSREAYP
ncbi:M15 family metallopeptidase [Aeromonas hydrophila]|uniref:M15 family metallopeptidase n=1 Tax=Aeromonas hydrophila TaxID=644 RepID=UPI0005753E1A|nr:M15 family metallopeptidase [Aeromonas hydrophila]KHN49558.1 peptidase M15 [Aeromonas hydrophila]OFC43048.1 peptidase M15 [Aeromonas hydrophila]OFC48561.1 peptidase M15 [Aeromonas hydrophila]